MKGLIYKDILTLRSYSKTFFLMTFVFLGVSIFNHDFMNFMVFWIPFFTVMMCVSTFTYDEYNKWDGYALTLPLDRAVIVKSKYVLFASFLLVSVAVSMTLFIGMRLAANEQVNIAELGYTLLGMCGMLFLMASSLLPLIYKFGPEKGRLYLFLVLGIIAMLAVGGFTLMGKILPEATINQIGIFLATYGWILILGVLLLLFYGSYRLSRKFYEKKEF